MTHAGPPRPRRSEIERLDRFFLALGGGVGPTEPALRDQVLSLMFRWRAGVLTGLACSLPMYLTAIVLLDAIWPSIWAAVDIMLSAARWQVVSDPRLTTPQRRARAVGWLMVFGLIWAILLGTGSALCIASGNMTLIVLAVGAIGASVGVITFRNAPTPRLARLMIVATMFPPVLAGTIVIKGPLSVLGLLLIPWSVALFALVRQNFDVIRTAAAIKLKLHLIARTDPLTGLKNRLAFNEHLAQLATSGHEHAQIVYLDLDGFKQVNDRFGHDAGDTLLSSAAQRFRGAVRGEDLLFRLGGDEFAIVMEDVVAQEAEAMIQRLIATIERRFEVGPGVWANVGVSVGSAQWGGAQTSPAEVLRAADAALYQAKQQGRGRHVRAAA